jgi:phosphoglycolate phosphatase-like HAD superfamily hydrolase
MDPMIEIVRPDYPRGGFRAALFDFDGTLSLLRRNWQEVMIPMMVDMLAATDSGETPEQLRACVEDFVTRLTGRQTIYQMIRLAEEVARRGGTPRDPLEYKRQYHDLLWQQVAGRVDAVADGRVTAEAMTVPGSRELLAALDQRGLTLYLASGTDLDYVRQEARLLELDTFFGPRIYGALDDYRKFSKAMIIEQMIRDTGLDGREIVGFGDGFVEMEEIKQVGGLAVGVASDEETREGVHPWKRRRLIEAGADLIIPDYRELGPLLERLFG